MYGPEHYFVYPPSFYAAPCPCEDGLDCPTHGPVEPLPDEPDWSRIDEGLVAHVHDRARQIDAGAR